MHEDTSIKDTNPNCAQGTIFSSQGPNGKRPLANVTFMCYYPEKHMALQFHKGSTLSHIIVPGTGMYGPGLT
jgi:hypothetical protein